MVNGSIEGMISGSSQRSGKAAGHASEQRRPPSVRGYNRKILMDILARWGCSDLNPSRMRSQSRPWAESELVCGATSNGERTVQTVTHKFRSNSDSARSMRNCIDNLSAPVSRSFRGKSNTKAASRKKHTTT